jgi:diacylglycerol O-acyltransferase-1
MLVLQLFIVTAYVIEFFLSRKILYEPVGMMLHHINIHASLATSIFIVWNFIETPAAGGCLFVNAAITWMKLISYALANQDYRLSANSEEGDSHQATLALIENLDSNDLDIQYPR